MIPPPPPPPAICPTCSQPIINHACRCGVRGNDGDRNFNVGVAAPIVEVGRAITKPTAKRINVRAKGQRGEREVVGLLQAIVDVVRQRRGLPTIVVQRNTLQAHLGGEDIFGLDGFAIEVKFQESDYNPAWWRQCLRQAELRDNATPILFYRKSKQKWSIKFRAYVNTPGDRDQVEMDCETNIDDFTEWFGSAYDERLDKTTPY